MAAPAKKPQRRVSLIGQLGLDCDFVAFSDKNNHVTYEIKLKCQANDTTWTVKKRYSDFHNLDKALHGDRNFRGVKLPNLPPKSFSFTDASKRELTEKRMAQLQLYLREMVSRNVFLSSETVIKFLEMPNSVRSLAEVLSQRQNAPLKQGWMYKKGAINKKWKKRWFVLQPNYILKYYKADDSNDPQGSIDITTIAHINTKDSSNDKKHSFALKTRDRVWLLAVDDEQSRRAWTRLFLRLKDTKAPPRQFQRQTMDSVNNGKSNEPSGTSNQRLSLNLGPHFRPVTKIAWSPVIPGILATGSEDESVKIWNTQLLDHTLMPSEPMYQDEAAAISNGNENDEKTDKTESCANGNDENGGNDNKGNSSSVNKNGGKKKWRTTYPIHAVEFRPVAEYKTSGKVTSLEWSPDGLMLVVSLKKEFKSSGQDNGGSGGSGMSTDDLTDGGNNNGGKYGYFIQCFDLSPVLGTFTEEDDDDDDDGNDNDQGGDQQRTKIFTLQDHPSQLCFSGDGNNIYMSMDIDPNSEENEKRRPAFLVYLDLTQNQLHRCKTVDRIIDHQTEFIVALGMNHSSSLMVVATCTHQGQGRLIAWDVEKNETRLVERQGNRVSFMTWTEDDSWLIVGRTDGQIEFWSVYNQDNKKLTGIYKEMIAHYNESQTNNQSKKSDLNGGNDNERDDTTNDKNDKNDKIDENENENDGDNKNGNNNNESKNDGDDEIDEDDNLHDKSVDIERAPSVAIFEQKFTESVHSGPVFNLTASNGILISSAKPTGLDYGSFFVDSCVWDCRGTMNNGAEPKMIARLHNINDTERDITRLLALSPVTPRHVREGGGPGTLLAASGLSHVYCHNMMDVILDALTRPTDDNGM